jgi:ribonuclease-3 family protein
VNSRQEELLGGEEEPPKQDLSKTTTLLETAKLPQKISQSELPQISPTALAYVGDAIYELYVRMYYLMPLQRPDSYHRLVVAQVRAEKQALHLRSLMPLLRTNELEIVRRGRNAAKAG